MKITKHIVKGACKTATKLMGHRGCNCYFLLGQTAIDLMDECFDINPCTGEYEYHIFEPIDKWLGHFDDRRCWKFAKFLNKRLCTEVTAEELLECDSIDKIAKLINDHTGRFFPEYCKYCVDK